MRKHYVIMGVMASVCMSSAFAAKPVDLRHQSVAALSNLLPSMAMTTAAATGLKEVKRSKDVKQTTHVRLKQMYQGVPVLGGDVIVHIPQGGNTMALTSNKDATMNGLIYQDLSNDLGQKPALTSNAVLQHAITLYQKSNKSNTAPITKGKTHLVVYVDKNQKAHWSYVTSFFVEKKGLPEKPSFIIDATTMTVYKQWNNIQTVEMSFGGGYGGNEKMGRLTYDGLGMNLPRLTVDRDNDAALCKMANADVTVTDRRFDDHVVEYACVDRDRTHGNVWWNGDFDAVNGGFSPSNDALYAGRVIQDMYLKWYNTPALVDYDGEPMMLTMRVHEDMDNAYWDGEQMTFGDGVDYFYPLVSLGVAAHEVSHGFTEQHSGLEYYDESGGLNESFSDMAAQAAEFYSNRKNSWQIGPEIMKDDRALRYMDVPSKDCFGGVPGDWCSIDKVSQYSYGLDVHYSSGVFNRAFYLIANSRGWNTKKAFDVMVKANQDYWTPYTSWSDAACGVLNAAYDLGYNDRPIKKAFREVEVDISYC